MDDEVMTLEEVARLMRISPATLQNRIGRRRDYPPYRRPAGGKRIWLRSEVMDWLRGIPVIAARKPTEPVTRRRRGRPTKREVVEGRR